MGTTKTAAKTDRLTCPPDHKHNTTCYRWHCCRCKTCRASIAKESRDYRRTKAYGRPTSTLTPAEPVREHVTMLRNAGMGQERIAELAGVPIHVLRSLNYSDSGRPPVQRLRAASANAILNVLPDPALLLRRDPRGTQRRLQALAVRGWSLASQARMLGMPQQGVHALMSVKWVTPETADRVRALFEDLWDVDPPGVTPADRQSSAYAKRVARKHGWFPPLAWDDIDTDEQPHRPNPTNRQAGNVAERAEQVRELHRLRWSDRHIAAELEINERTVVRIRQRLGLPGWTKNQQEAA